MTNNQTFKKAYEKHLKTLKQYVPIVARVHGGTHPKFYEVRELFDTINVKAKEKSSATSDLTEEFAKLREITHNYTVPHDVCESYEAVYQMLAELDKAYHSK